MEKYAIAATDTTPAVTGIKFVSLLPRARMVHVRTVVKYAISSMPSVSEYHERHR